MNLTPRKVLLYQTAAGECPYQKWFDKLHDTNTEDKILARIGRLRLGHFGEYDSVGDGLIELILDFGPGYRIYFGQKGREVVIVLIGGDKSTQDSDIKTAKKYWKDYENRTNKTPKK